MDQKESTTTVDTIFQVRLMIIFYNARQILASLRFIYDSLLNAMNYISSILIASFGKVNFTQFSWLR